MARILILVFISLLLGCPPGNRSVGGACRDDFDCADRCLEDWPGGFCTIECRDDRDCPASSVCTDHRGGVCLLLCDSDRECRDVLDDNDYECRRRDNVDRGSDDVCYPD